VQNPDSRYKPFWNATLAVWAVEHALGNTEMLRPWVDVDLAAPRPWYFSNWAMRVLRYEHGLPPTHPNDPPRRAMLGACRRTGQAADRRAPKTEEEWLAISLDKCDIGDDEEGDSDAGSINDDVERGLPTSSHWDPDTRKSTTPRGNVPHPHPAIVQAELERNRRYEERIAREGRQGGQAGQSTTDARPVGGSAAAEGRRMRRRRSNVGTTTGPASHSALPAGPPQDVEMQLPPDIEMEPPQDVEMGSVDGPQTAANLAPASPAESDMDALGEDDDRLGDHVSIVPDTSLLPPAGQFPPPPGQVTDPSNTPSSSSSVMTNSDATVALSIAPVSPTTPSIPAASVSVSAPPGPPTVPTAPVAPSSGAVAGFGPPRRFVVPPPSAPTVRRGPRGGSQSTREEARGFTLEPQ
jgi:hypothetical protein